MCNINRWGIATPALALVPGIDGVDNRLELADLPAQ
jgi:hypothetical protein